MSSIDIRGVAALILLNFIYIGLLPRIFFRQDGTFNLRWWVTASPLFVTPIVVLLIELKILEPARPSGDVAAVILSALSIGLISLALGNHRVPLSLWHQDNDAPKEIVTWGAYKRIRHPFYTAFLLSQLAAVIYTGHPVVAGAALLSAVVLNQTAKKEEQKLSSSLFGQKYQDYLKVTGRFLPRFKGRA